MDLPSFREYGPHRIDLSCDEAPAEPLLIELIAEAHLSDASITPGTVFFSEGNLTAQWDMWRRRRLPADIAIAWRYGGACRNDEWSFALNHRHGGREQQPFHFDPKPGTCDEYPTEWSPVQSPFQPLLLRADGSQISNDASTFSAKPVQ